MSVLSTFTLHIYESNNVLLSAFTFNKKPPNPFKGILGENVTLEWNFTLTSAETFHYFVLLEDGRHDMIIYTESNGASTYDSYIGRVTLARNGTPSFTLINLTSGNDGNSEYCLKVSTKLKDDPAKTHMDCTRLEILGKVTFKLHMHVFDILFSLFLLLPSF